MILSTLPPFVALAHLPLLLTDFFDAITDFGKSGWFLWPLGILFRAFRLPAWAHARVAARTGGGDGAIASCLRRLRVPGVFTNFVKHVFGRARPGLVKWSSHAVQPI